MFLNNCTTPRCSLDQHLVFSPMHFFHACHRGQLGLDWYGFSIFMANAFFLFFFTTAKYLPKTKFVNGNSYVSGLTVALVDVSVIHGDNIHITKDEAFIVIFLQSFCKAHIQEFGSVKPSFSILQTDIA